MESTSAAILAEYNNMLYFECSAKTGYCIDQIFTELALYMLELERNKKVE